MESEKMFNYSKLSQDISKWLKDYAEKHGVSGFTIGVSGGVDSAVVSAICAETGMNLLILEMPIHQKTEEVTRAKKHISWLKKRYSNVQSAEIDLTQSFDTLSDTLKESTFNGSVSDNSFNFTMANTRSRLRMTTLYAYAGMHRLLVVGTGNKVEDFGIGFYTKYGDGGVDISPIADLMKSEVYALGKELGIIQEILVAAPTDGLHGDERTDEEQLGCTYDELEWAMKYVGKNFADINLKVHPFNDCSDRQKEVVKIYLQRRKANIHKMNKIPVFKTLKYRK